MYFRVMTRKKSVDVQYRYIYSFSNVLDPQLAEFGRHGISGQGSPTVYKTLIFAAFIHHEQS